MIHAVTTGADPLRTTLYRPALTLTRIMNFPLEYAVSMRWFVSLNLQWSFLKIFSWLVVVVGAVRYLCEVGTQFLCTIQSHFMLKMPEHDSGGWPLDPQPGILWRTKWHQDVTFFLRITQFFFPPVNVMLPALYTDFNLCVAFFGKTSGSKPGNL
jgi:hypothetical protein